VVLPPTTVRRFVRQVKADVDALQQRYLSQPDTERLNEARTDLIRLLADCAALEQLGAFQVPALIRTSVSCAMYGSGLGALVVGTKSEPFELVDGITDQLRIGLNGAAAVQYSLPDSPNSLWLDFPLAIPAGGWYVFPNGKHHMRLLVDGREGTEVTINAALGPWTPAAVAAQINATLGAIPENPGGSPLLVVDEFFFGGSSTVRVRYNVGVPSPANTGIGCYVEIRGDVDLMCGAPPTNYGFGWLTPDAGSTTTRTARNYWKPTSRRTVIDYLSKQLYGADKLGDVAHLYGDTSVVTSGMRGSINPAAPTTFRIYNYSGTGTWYPATSRLTLTGDDLAWVSKGDLVYLNGAVVVYEVASKLPDGITVTLVSGTPPAAGSYPVVISPPQKTVTTGMTLGFIDRGVKVYSRITSATYESTGVLLLGMDRRASLLPYTPVEGIHYTVERSVLVVKSNNDGPTGSTKIEAFVGADASGVIGMSGLTPSLVDQLYAATANFSESGVQVGDYVYSGGFYAGEILEILSDQVVRLDTGSPAGTATMEFRNRKYQLYNTMLVGIANLSSAPTIAAVERLVLECLRAPKTLDTAASLVSTLSSMTATITPSQVAISAFRSGFGAPSGVLTDCREALEESGADRAADLLATGKLVELFSAGMDDTSYSRRLLRSVRAVSRTALGTSVFAPSIRQEADAMAPPNEMELGLDILPQEELGAPGMTKR
ncbi:MAG: hypothetical protein KKC80_08830, partial [Candidatus Margulisbacteria bacterium]|nr:hypothetical protein [Candidatus Margulisiibacteriota bacterium]